MRTCMVILVFEWLSFFFFLGLAEDLAFQDGQCLDVGNV